MDVSKRLHKALNKGDAYEIEKCFDVIYNEYSKLVYVIISKYISDKLDIEELTNDVFVNFFNHLDNIDFNKNIKYYLMTSAKNISINFLKKKRINYVKMDNDVIAGYPSESQNTDYRRIIDKLKKVISEEELEIIIRHVLEGELLKDIAISKNKSPNTIKSIYRRAIKKIQNKYKEVDFNED